MSIIEGINVDIVDVHISTIKNGDTVLHDEKLMTVSSNDLSRVDLLGITLFGDSYHAGHKSVKKAIIKGR